MDPWENLEIPLIKIDQSSYINYFIDKGFVRKERVYLELEDPDRVLPVDGKGEDQVAAD